MHHTVPLARRNLFQDRRRAVLSVSGVASALLLVLILQGIFVGAMAQVTRYLDRLPADVIVSQRGVRTMHMSTSALPADTTASAEAVDGAAWAEPIRFATGVITAPSSARQLSYLIGFDPVTNRAGPHQLTAGALPDHGEGVLDEVAADQLDVGIGDELRVYGSPVRIAGLSEGGTSITNTTLFVRLDDMAALQPDSISYILVGAEPGTTPSELRDRLGDTLPDTTVQTRSEFSRSEARIVSDMSADVMRIMNIVALGIALAVIALALFTLTLAKLRDYGIVKAIGARPSRLARVILAQAAWTVTAALTLAVLAALGAGMLIGRVQPAVEIIIEPAGVARLGLTALGVGAVGALLPLRRVLAVDPASAFRRAA
jgi:putative ABC transport system permease protein